MILLLQVPPRYMKAPPDLLTFLLLQPHLEYSPVIDPSITSSCFQASAAAAASTSFYT
jgi:hypothetical protein